MSLLEVEYKERQFEFTLNSENEDEENIGEEFKKIKEKLVEKMNEIHEICLIDPDSWRRHTKKMHKFAKIRKNLCELSICPSQAFCKFSEILSQFPHIFPFHSLDTNYMRSFHLCEGPGYFITALDTYLANKLPNIKWEWNATTLNPYYENTKSCEKLLDDSLIMFQYGKWEFGRDNSGNIFSLANEFCEKCEEMEKYDIITADGSIYVQDRPGEQEDLVLDLLQVEVNLAMKLLAKGGTMILKMYTLFSKTSRELLQRICKLFGKCVAFKPCSSKPGNSEKYLICFDYLGNSQDFYLSEKNILKCETMFALRQIQAISRNVETFKNGYIQTNKERKKENRIISEIVQSLTFDGDIFGPKRFPCVFPADEKFRPWAKMFGVNLVDRISRIQNPKDAKEYISQFVGKIEIARSQEIFNDGIFTIFNNFKRLKLNVFVEYSSNDIENNHSLFIDPVILHSINILENTNFVDIFSQCSSVSRVERPISTNVSDSMITVSCEMLTCLQDILKILMIIVNQEIPRVTLKWNGPKESYLLSRLSASIISLFLQLFEKLEIDCESEEIRFSQQCLSEYPNVKEIITNIDCTIQKIDHSMFVRSFISISDLANYHDLIHLINLCKLEYYQKLK